MGTEYHQAYNAPIGTVINVDAQSFSLDLGALNALAAGRMPERAALAPTLINRSPQFNAIADKLLALQEAGEAGTMMVTLTGAAGDLHQALVMRLARIEFVNGYGGSGGWQYLKRLEWPEGATSVDAVVRTVRDALGLPRTYDRVETEKAVALLNRNLCFSHFIDSERWASDRGALARKWIDYVASGALRPRAGHFMVVFLCLRIDETPRADCRRLIAFADQINSETGNAKLGNILVAPPLGLIRRDHVDEWVAAAARYLVDDQVEADLLDLAGQFFNSGPEKRRLTTVFSPAQEALARALGTKARFLETIS